MVSSNVDALECDTLHGKVIKYEEIKNIPSRNAFLDKKIHNETNDTIAKGSPLLFMPNSLHEMHLQNKKYEKAQYKIVLFGILLDGRKANVVISGIKPYFEAIIPNTDKGDESDRALLMYQQLQQHKYACPNKFEILKARPFKKYQENRSVFARFYFDKLKTRTEAIKHVRSQGFETTADDMSCYYRVVCRDYLTSFSSWVKIIDYNVRTYANIREPVFDVHINNYKLSDEDIMSNNQLAKDNTMSCGWDIETYSADGDVPKPDNLNHCVFMISCTFQWYHSDEQLLRVCLVDLPSKPRPDFLTIVCGTEKKLIKAYGKIMNKMKPEIITGFNDSDYDWPWLIVRGKAYPGTLAFLGENFDCTRHWKNYDDNDVFRYNYKEEKVKLEAETYAIGSTLTYPGYINIDVRTIFRQLYPTAEKSNLNFYLDLNKLGSKKDMPYQEMFQIYGKLKALVSRRTAIQNLYDKYDGMCAFTDTILDYDSGAEYERLTDLMGDVAEYCVIDAQRCHELLKIRSVIMDRREVANLSYTSMFDSLYRANGMKVRNLVIARGQTRGIKFSNITNSSGAADGKYPGAYVFPPKKGLVTSKLTIHERVSHSKLMSKYAEWFNVSNDELKLYDLIISENGCCPTKEKILELKLKHNLRNCFVDFLREPIGRPITGLDFSSLYPSLIMTYNLSPEYIITNSKDARKAHDAGHILYKIKFIFNERVVRGWSIRHDNKIDPDDPECKFGIYPMILKELFDKRKTMKKDLHEWESKKEKLEMLTRDEFTKPEIKAEYDNVCFNFNYINSKQSALKVFMNTFYGESGNKHSPFFVLQLAGAITTSGQDNIKMVQKYVEDVGCNVYYGDSVTGDTPLVLRDSITGIVYIKTIDDLVKSDSWNSYDQFKQGESDRINKQQAKCLMQIWAEGEWRNINRVIRHKTNKKIYRVNTHTGCIDVTEDHSLMTPARIKIKPTELTIGSELLHSFPEEFPEIISHESVNNNNHVMTKGESYVWGFFLANGSCGKYECLSGSTYGWSIDNQNITYLNQVLEYLSICEPNLKFKLLDTMGISGVYKLVASGHVRLLVEKYRKLFYDKRKYKIVPTQILNGSRVIRQSFYDGYYAGDGGKTIEQNTGTHAFYCNGKLTSQGMYYLVKSLGYKYVSINTCSDKPDIYRIKISRISFRKNPIAIKKLYELPEITRDTFVYDIETTRGTFLGGVGSLNVKNTDSIYSSMPEHHFDDIDRRYYTGKMTKEEFWIEMVNITFKEIAKINDDVNKMLYDDNGTKFLKMAFEESLFPVAFLAKKKYYGIPHISEANFNPKNLFIRGLEVKKRGVSEFLRKVCLNIMWDSVSKDNVCTLMELVEMKIDFIYSKDWDFSDFIMTEVFKPQKQNIKVHTFAKRMLSEGIKIKPHERFNYVIVKKNPYKYDYRGRKKELMIGERMEYDTRAKELRMEIDLDYYMKGSINGQLSRLITYADTFHVEPASTDLDDLKTAEDKTYQNACKYIENYCGKYYTTYGSKGKIYQKIFKMANKAIIDKAKEHCSAETVEILNSSYDVENLEEWLETKAEKNVLRTIKGYGLKYVKSVTDNLDDEKKCAKIKELQSVYFADKRNNIARERERAFNERRTLLQRQVRDNVGKLINVLNFQSQIVSNVSETIKQALNINNMYNNAGDDIPEFENLTEIKELDDEEMIKTLEKNADTEFNKIMNNNDLLESLNKLRCIYLNMISNYNFIHQTRSIVDYLRICRNASIGYVGKPKTFDTKKHIKGTVDDLVAESMGGMF